MKKYIFAFCLAVLAIVSIGIFLTTNGSQNSQDKSELSIIATNFIGYDFARAITKNTDADIKMLVPPGSDIHNFDPTPADIVQLKNASLTIYNGGESDEWLKNLLQDNEINPDKTFRMMDSVELKAEKITEGMTTTNNTSDAEYDEHIWTSIPNAIKIIKALKAKISQISPQNAKIYEENTMDYITQLQDIDNQISNIVDDATRKELVFADRFPFRYFADEYGLDYAAAFPGCSEQSEASSQTIAYLINKVKSDNIPVILKIELTSDSLAQTISEATGAKILTMQAGHNISTADFQNGTTYLDLLNANLNTLKEALN